MRFIVLLALALSTFWASASHAITVSPMSVRLDPSTGRTYETIVVRNTSSRTAVIETFAERRDIGSNGSLNLSPADDDFIVFPPISSVAPGASQAFRIQWVGNLAPRPSANYFVTILRLPIDADQAEAEAGPRPADQARMLLRLGYAFKIAVGVAPTGVKANIAATFVGPGPYLPSGRPSIAVRMTNTGNGYGSLPQYSYTLTNARGSRIQTSYYDWGDQAGDALFPAGHSRTVNIPVPDTSWAGGATIQMTPLR